MNKMQKICAMAVVGCLAAMGAAFAAATVGIAVPYVTSITVTDAIQVVKGAVPSAQSTYATGLQLRNFILGNNSQFGATAPTLTSCGSGSPAVVGSNVAGTITMGTSATGCVATFATAYALAPSCTVVSETAPATTTPAYSVSATAITITQTSTSGNKYDYVCVAQPGG